MNLSFLRVGDVLRIDNLKYVVDMVNDCRARCQPIEKQTKTVKRTTRTKGASGKVNSHTVERVVTRFGPRDVSVSPRIEPGTILRHMSRDELQQFLVQPKTIQPAAPDSTETAESETTECKVKVMAKKNNAEVKINKVGKGRASMIHQLRNEGVAKDAAFEQAKKKFPELGESLFEKIWKRGAKSVEAVTTPAKATAKKSVPPVPSKKKSVPPVPAKRAQDQLDEKKEPAAVAS